MITDYNINILVRIYISGHKSKLPNNLQKKQIGEWDVSKVTNMNKLFEYTDFNEPLNHWNVSNVTNMKQMFFNCREFNQPLNHWDVSNVTDMVECFMNVKNLINR